VRLFNAAGRLLRSAGLRRPLSADAILRDAQRQTGLADCGDEAFRAGLDRLVRSLEEDAELNSLGRHILHDLCTTRVKMRLYLQDWLTHEPSILKEEVRRPIFVVGFPRTGTTLLHNLLCQDRRGRPLLLWEALEPLPPPGFIPGLNDPRIERGRRFVDLSNRYGDPQVQAIHCWNADGPEECLYLLLNTFRTPAYRAIANVRGYLEWLRERADQERLPVYQEYRHHLQFLQWRRGGRHWVLKAPFHLWGLDVLLQLFPDALVVQTHRPMEKVIPSVLSLEASARGAFSDHVDCQQMGREIEDYYCDFFEPMTKARAAHPGRVFDLHYRDLVRDPVAAVESIYEHFQITPEDGMVERVRQYVGRNPQNKHGVHRYSLAQFGLSEADIEKWFGSYQEQYGIKPEAART
jgi:hypothetical protein